MNDDDESERERERERERKRERRLEIERKGNETHVCGCGGIGGPALSRKETINPRATLVESHRSYLSSIGKKNETIIGGRGK